VDSPPSESVARELVSVLREDPEQVEEVWAKVVEEHGPEPTAVEVRAHVERRKPVSRFQPPTEEDVHASKDRLMELVTASRALPWDLRDLRVEAVAKSATDDQIKVWIWNIQDGERALREVRTRLARYAEWRTSGKLDSAA
jgi:hypothetical protein